MNVHDEQDKVRPMQTCSQGTGKPTSCSKISQTRDTTLAYNSVGAPLLRNVRRNSDDVTVRDRRSSLWIPLALLPMKLTVSR